MPPEAVSSRPASSPTAGRAGTFIHRNGFAQQSVAGRREKESGAILFLLPRSRRSGAEQIRSRSAVTGRAGSMVAPRAAPPAGAFLSGQAVFHGRELLAELPLVSDLPSSRWGWLLGAGDDGACDSPWPRS